METHTLEIPQTVVDAIEAEVREACGVKPHSPKIIAASRRTLRQRYDDYAASKARLKAYTEAYLALKYMSNALYEGARIPDAIFNAKREIRSYMREEQIQHVANKKVWKFMLFNHHKLF